MWNVHNIKMRRAAKQHRCCECGKVIHVGEYYEHVWGIHDYEPATERTCGHCANLRENYEKYMRKIGHGSLLDEMCFGQLFDWLQEDSRPETIIFIQACL